VDGSEVDVRYEPFKEIVVMERNFFSTPDDIARFTSVIAGGKLAGLYWAEGIVFLYFPLPASTETAAKALIENKRVYWTFVGYSLMPKYQPTIETKEKMIVPVIDKCLDRDRFSGNSGRLSEEVGHRERLWL
jgi:hypothetical protein